MDRDTKKLIAREGLILLGILVLAAIIVFGLSTTEFVVGGEQPGQKIFTFAFMLVLLGYPMYLLIRFVFWAIRTLKEK